MRLGPEDRVRQFELLINRTLSEKGGEIELSFRTNAEKRKRNKCLLEGRKARQCPRLYGH